ncbi:patatin-like phospholipase family protein [Paraburkholderia sp. UYCP14C]|uniref:patatin-like phospholipase family protein n=1 Tax=Paraburkholderia sp. UYCP14C TaxID=2511130 RepID=UPI001021821E|nr:patatin-like phospholipase family protein [Paraburkholderia sp. UYCP14C]RZF27921.1 patatin-like phospholipase family protein [Paraburkholderia sp. UYCP14C]
MNPRTKAPTSKAPVDWGRFANRILVLQGGGALGAYQAGVYQGLAEAGLEPNWISGVSIGAINASLIAGNPAEQRVRKLREFWERSSSIASFVPPASLDPMRPFFNAMGAASAVMMGVPGFFSPRIPPPFMAPEGSLGAISFYDTQPLKATLEELVDFDLINSKRVRLSLGAVNVCTGDSVYFDSMKTRIAPEHVMASGALPPGFPPVNIDGQWYWDGGISSNTPLWYVVDEAYRESGVVVQVDVFSGTGRLPENLRQVQERLKDLQYASKMRFSGARLKEQEELRASLRRMLDKIPPELQSDPDVQRLTAISTRGEVALVHFTNHHNTRSSDFKDYEFSRATVNELWEGGLGDVRSAIERQAWRHAVELAHDIKVIDLTPQCQENTP